MLLRTREGVMDDLKRRWSRAVSDEHSPYWKPEETRFPPPQESWASFFIALVKVVLIAIGLGLVLAGLK